jgi:hypothetical protein
MGAYLAATLAKIPGSGTWPPVGPPWAPPPASAPPCAAIDGFEVETQSVCGEGSQKFGVYTSGKKGILFEGGSETDISSVSLTFNCVKSG